MKCDYCKDKEVDATITIGRKLIAVCSPECMEKELKKGDEDE